MTILAFAFWRRLDTPGHDVCRLEKHPDGWRLQGTAVFWHRTEPASFNYCVDCDSGWKTVRGKVEGFLGKQAIRYIIARQSDIWTLNGAAVPGLERLVDLDLGFTPATNLQQLRRVPIAENESAQVPVAWLDIETGMLTELSQSYERRSATTFWYEARSVGYKGLLEIAPNGFIRLYPGLWEAETGWN
jgi:hypothetical protein